MAITEGADERMVLQALKSLSFSVRFKVLAPINILILALSC